MRRFLLSLGIATIVVALVPRQAAAAPARRIVVAGREGDALTERVQKELAAMGVEVVRVEAGDGCSRSAVSSRVREAAAHAATCTDGDAVGVWIIEPAGLRLRDVIVARTPDDEQRDMAALRAAETARASIDLLDQEAEAKAQAAKSAPPPPPSTVKPPASASPTADRPASAPAKKDIKRTPAFVAGVGLSTLMGADASVAAFSAEAEVGVTRWLAIAPRLELPVEDRDVAGAPSLKVRPGFTGIAALVPVMHPGSFVIPRFGAGVGAAWITADASPTSFTRFEQDGSVNTFPTTTAGSDTTWSFAAYGTAALSMRIFGPVRMNVDGVFGSTMARLVVRTQGNDRAYWGAPFGALAIRLEALFL
jgi:hypothetical protein